MRNLLLVANLDIRESVKRRWFLLYSLIFGGLMGLFFISGVSQSQVMGFSGLSRVLLVYIQVTVAVLPLFVLISTVRTISSDRESSVLEYMLSFPVSLKEYYWGKFIGRFCTVFLPVFFVMLFAIAYGIVIHAPIPWGLFFLYSALLFSLCFVFLSLAFFISSSIKSSEAALGTAFFLWISMLAFVDIALIGLMLKSRLSTELIITIALLNPLEVFRVAAIALFDNSLTVMGPVAFYILDFFRYPLFILYAVLYPLTVGLLFAFFGYRVFRTQDII